MTFNEGSKLQTGKARKRGKAVGVAAGGGGLLVLALAVLGPMLGIDLGPIAGLFGGGDSSPGQEESLEHCQTGADANRYDDCRIVGAQNSLNDYWEQTLPEFGQQYVAPSLELFSDATQSGCGAASSQMGPFYCPADQTVYMDTTFFATLRQDFGATAGPLAQLYITAHEWGHHVQNITGIMNGLDLRATGPAADSVRLELQADCFAGAWVQAASATTDAQGNRLLNAPTRSEIQDALNAAESVGDDHIMEQAGVNVNPERFSHGSSQQRVRWFQTGYEDGPNSCDTFGIPAGSL